MVFRSFSKLHPNGPVPRQISPPNSQTRCELSWLLLTCPNHTLGEAPPSDTANHYFWPEPPSQKTYLFHPAAGESHPSRLRASISSQVTASASRPPNFTFLSLPVQHSESWSPVGRWREPPGQTTLPFKPVARRGLPVQHGDSEPQSDVGEHLRDKQPYLFKSPARRALPVRHGDSVTTVGRRREPPGQTNFPFPSCGRQGLSNHAAGWLRGLPTP